MGSISAYSQQAPQLPIMSIKLTYFNLKGRAEFARLVLVQAGEVWEDVRVDQAGWAQLKPTLPLSQIPCIEVDGVTICQSMTIARYLARRCGLAGSTDLEAAQADEAVDTVSDWIQQQKEAIKPPLPGQKPVMQREFVDVQLQAWLGKMERLLTSRGGKHFSGAGLTWADLAVFHVLDSMEDRLNEQEEHLNMDSFPRMKELEVMVRGLPNIKKWLATRPKTPF